ncbi:patatin-like phospholipase family protein [bacterium]|nr:patatin-like phospholipase family protein [bacterium]NUN44190.1 patatin-like phospholipase family protein [bacterium]
MFGQRKIALALGGGGARGLAHIGVLKTLERHHIPMDIIVGSGIGAVVGAMYAQSLHIVEVESRIKKFFLGDDFKKTGLHLFRRDMHPENFFGQIARAVGNELLIQLYADRMSLMKENRLGIVMDELLGDGLIENTRIQFAAVATNMITGKTEIFREGSIKEAAKASSSIPGFLPPMQYEDKVLVDGAVAAQTPVDAAWEMGADYVIAVDTSRTLAGEAPPANMIDLLFRTHLITALQANALMCSRSTVHIRPEVGHHHWAAFEKMNELIAAGEKSVDVSINAIFMALKKEKSRLSKHRLSKV